MLDEVGIDTSNLIMEEDGYAANAELVAHYCKIFKAEHIAMLHPFRGAIVELIRIYEEEH